MPFSFHSHSGQFCKHARGNLEDVVLKAAELGFSHYGLSEHMPRYRKEDFYEEEMHLEPSDLVRSFDDYVVAARQLQAKYADRIKLLVGLETEYVRPGTIAEVNDLVRRHAVDYVVGSVHHVLEVPIDFSRELLDAAETKAGGTEQMFRTYFEHQYEMLRGVRPQTVGHFDLIRLWRPDFPLSNEVWQLIDRNIRYAVGIGALFEVNSRALKKNLPSPYPLRDVFQRIVHLGGKFTLADDSHGPDDVAMHFRGLRTYLLERGVHSLFYLERDSDSGTTIAKELVDWSSHRFWSQFSP